MVVVHLGRWISLCTGQTILMCGSRISGLYVIQPPPIGGVQGE